MRTLLFGLGALLAIGCGGSDDNPIDGTWYATINGSCGVAATFDHHARTYASQLMCELTNGTIGDEIEGGDADFSVSGRVTITPRRASCPTSDHTVETNGYTFQGKNLGLITPSGLIVFEPVPQSSSSASSAVVQFGCWSMGTFRQHDVQDL